MQSAQIFDQIAARLPDLLVKGACLDNEAEIDSLVRKGIEGACPTTERVRNVDPDVLSIVREIEHSETSLTSDQAVTFANPFFDAIVQMGAALRDLRLGSAYGQELPELDPAYEIMPAQCFDRNGIEWSVLLRSRPNGRTSDITEHGSFLGQKPTLTPVLSDGKWWIAASHPTRYTLFLFGGPDASSMHTSEVSIKASCYRQL